MKNRLILALALLAGSASAQQPLTFSWYACDPHQIADALVCATERWRDATGLPIEIAYYGAAHWVRQDAPANLPPGAQAVTWGSATGWNEQRIKLATSLLDDFARCQILVHEMGHVLRRNYGHSTEDGSMSWPITHVYSSQSGITAGDLALVCAKQPCLWQIPE